jgi:hypothetical protein
MEHPVALTHPLALPAAVLLLITLALALPPLPQAAAYHHFADQRTLLGVPHAMDVLSNLGFAAAGLALWRRATRCRPCIERPALHLAALGLLLTAAGSALYHLQPDDAGLLADRAGMALAFAGLLGVAGCRVGARGPVLHSRSACSARRRRRCTPGSRTATWCPGRYCKAAACC